MPNTAFFKRPKVALALKHVAAWLIYGGYVYMGNKFTNPSLKAFQIVLFLLPFCLFFYISLFSLHLYKKKGITWALISQVTFTTVEILVIYWYVFGLLPYEGVNMYDYQNPGVFLRTLSLGFLNYLAYAFLYFFIRETFEKNNRIKNLQEETFRLEREKLQTELENAILRQNELEAQQKRLQSEYAFLRSQINPHFLYNTLNVLFSQAMEYSQELADNIMKLSSMMRYSLESVEYESGKVSIQKELQNLQTLIDINNIRFDNSKMIQYEINGDFNGQMVPPLSLITVVENAFKYGDLKDPEHPLQIIVSLKPDEVYFFCRNKKRKNNIELSSHNIGLSNLKQRLDMVFRDKYDISTIDDGQFYTFELTIKSESI